MCAGRPTRVSATSGTYFISDALNIIPHNHLPILDDFFAGNP